MDATEIELENLPSHQTRYVTYNPYFRQAPILKLDNQVNKSNRKRVQFKLRTPSPKKQPNDNIKDFHSTTDLTQRSVFDHHDYSASFNNDLTTELIKVNNKHELNKRAKVTIVIIVILVMIIGIVIATTVSLTRSQKSVIKTTPINSLMSSSSIAATISTVIIGNQTGPPCTSYTTINDPSRSAASGSYSVMCDDGPIFNTSNGGAWIRFVGSGGTMLLSTAPYRGQCGSYLGGWYNGSLPATYSDIVNGTVYFNNNEFQSIIQRSISIMNCGSFYIYFLAPVPVCSARYCTA